ncbi:MAG: SRPBCC family protein [Actinomycetota bacterium]
MEPDVTVSREIAASPEAVYAAITDITRMGEWSPENQGGAWHEGFDGAEVGATFTSTNRNGDKEWQIDSVVTEAVPHERFFFDCQVRDFVFSKWGYSIEATGGGCTVTEYWQDLRPEELRTGVSPTSGVGDRVPHNRAGMEATLERLAAALES